MYVEVLGQPHANRIGDWLQTYTGGQIFPLDPREFEIEIRDIAHALAHLCRFNGHCKRFMSVAEHSCHVSDLCPPEHKLTGLLHDSSEAYLCDLPRPIKRSPGFADHYIVAEDRLMQCIAARFGSYGPGFTYPLPPEVKQADNQLLATEALQVMAPLHPEWRDRYNPVPDLVLPCWKPKRAKREFLRRFYALTSPRFVLMERPPQGEQANERTRWWFDTQRPLDDPEQLFMAVQTEADKNANDFKRIEGEMYLLFQDQAEYYVVCADCYFVYSDTQWSGSTRGEYGWMAHAQAFKEMWQRDKGWCAFCDPVFGNGGWRL